MTGVLAGPWAHLAVLAVSLLANAFVQVIVCRCSRREEGWVRSLLGGFAAGAAVAAALEAGLGHLGPSPGPAGAGRAAAVLLAYAGFSFFYANVVNGGHTALRVRLLAELRDAPGGLTLAEIVALYRPEEMFEARLSRMLLHGQLAVRDGRLHLVPGALLVIQRLLTAAKLVVIGKRSEFD